MTGRLWAASWRGGETTPASPRNPPQKWPEPADYVACRLQEMVFLISCTTSTFKNGIFWPNYMT